jgi:hypothetical protein
MANGDVDVTEGSGLKVGSYTISEDAVTRHLQRVVLNNSSGAEITATANGQATGANSAPVVMASDYTPPGVIVDDAAFAVASTAIYMSGALADESSTDSVNEGDGGAVRMTLDRKLITNPQPHTAGGLTLFRSLDLDETEEEVKATAGCLYKLRIANLATSLRYVKIYNATAANVTVGTTTPVDTIVVPPAAASGAIIITENFGGVGLTFDTAITLAATTGLADNDTGAPGASELVVSAYYK